MRYTKTRKTAYAAIIAAVYAALSLVSFSVNSFLFRPAEALTVLPCLTSIAIPGVTLGCLLSNYLTGCAPPDMFFGTLATLIGAWGTYLLRKHPILSLAPPIVSNSLILPPILVVYYQAQAAYPVLLLTTFTGELICCGILGYALRKALEKHPQAFRNQKFT